jgi:hypothetical protein
MRAMSARLLLALALVPTLAAAADAPKTVPITVRPVVKTVAVKPVAATPVPVATKPVAAKVVPPPFPPPAAGPIAQDTKYTTGAVALVDADKKAFELTTNAGKLVCHIGDTSKVIGVEGKPVLFTDLVVGANVRVYYRTGKGAEVVEADLLAAAH